MHLLDFKESRQASSQSASTMMLSLPLPLLLLTLQHLSLSSNAQKQPHSLPHHPYPGYDYLCRPITVCEMCPSDFDRPSGFLFKPIINAPHPSTSREGDHGGKGGLDGEPPPGLPPHLRVDENDDGMGRNLTTTEPLDDENGVYGSGSSSRKGDDHQHRLSGDSESKDSKDKDKDRGKGTLKDKGKGNTGGWEPGVGKKKRRSLSSPRESGVSFEEASSSWSHSFSLPHWLSTTRSSTSDSDSHNLSRPSRRGPTPIVPAGSGDGRLGTDIRVRRGSKEEDENDEAERLAAEEEELELGGGRGRFGSGAKPVGGAGVGAEKDEAEASSRPGGIDLTPSLDLNYDPCNSRGSTGNRRRIQCVYVDPPSKNGRAKTSLNKDRDRDEDGNDVRSDDDNETHPSHKKLQALGPFPPPRFQSPSSSPPSSKSKSRRPSSTPPKNTRLGPPLSASLARPEPTNSAQGLEGRDVVDDSEREWEERSSKSRGKRKRDSITRVENMDVELGEEEENEELSLWKRWIPLVMSSRRRRKRESSLSLSSSEEESLFCSSDSSSSFSSSQQQQQRFIKREALPPRPPSSPSSSINTDAKTLAAGGKVGGKGTTTEEKLEDSFELWVSCVRAPERETKDFGEFVFLNSLLFLTSLSFLLIRQRSLATTQYLRLAARIGIPIQLREFASSASSAAAPLVSGMGAAAVSGMGVAAGVAERWNEGRRTGGNGNGSVGTEGLRRGEEGRGGGGGDIKGQD